MTNDEARMTKEFRNSNDEEQQVVSRCEIPASDIHSNGSKAFGVRCLIPWRWRCGCRCSSRGRPGCVRVRLRRGLWPGGDRGEAWGVEVGWRWGAASLQR